MTFQQLLRFGFVGALNVIINATIYNLLVWLGVHYILASAAGVVFGVANSFILNKLFVFKAKGDTSRQFGKTLLVYAAQNALSWTSLAFWVEIANVGPYWAYWLTIVPVTIASFIGLRFFAFRPTPKATH